MLLQQQEEEAIAKMNDSDFIAKMQEAKTVGVKPIRKMPTVGQLADCSDNSDYQED